MRRHHLSMLCVVLAGLAGCDGNRQSADSAAPAKSSGIPTTVTDIAASDLPPELVSLVKSEVPDMQIEGAERKEREDRIYYDVEGRRADGSEVELDILQEGGAFKIVEIQRDIAWSEAPQAARDAAAGAQNKFEPVRVIESKQTDGSVIYELFTDGAPEKPALEVRFMEGKAEILEEEWPH
ncbi:hypothetical protein JM946_08700 [Steroidobacter sp. S1-65]|uniref:PepSY domain-containing protein n=1 Tax=Steroidobacter gossypii TaxID=2805490 RepID=A0ABS1WV25_9GAMM|nr:hypothetical protein [Steroidobacter gossypii]MBM0104825.1 hypothetical protein [Steroidobacter gossypii]